MDKGRNEDSALKYLLLQVEREMESVPLSQFTPAQIEQIALQTADHAKLLLSKNMAMQLSMEATVEELSPEHVIQICTMASNLGKRKITDAEDSLMTLREHGFEVRKFMATKFVPDDPRLREAPNQWIFKQVESGALPASATEPVESIMICEIRPKPDVHSDECWIQEPYANDPFIGELSLLHEQIDGYKLGKRVQPTSRAGFTFYELQEHVLPSLSKKAGVQLECMPAIHACILANDHPEVSAGRSTEWRGDTIGESYAVISGRSDRGPIRYTYYDVMSDPYINRGFRLCVRLGQCHVPDTESPL
ncbi:MAG: hypothetical protein ABIA92_02355 [Patescibacteria group bacterium]